MHCGNFNSLRFLFYLLSFHQWPTFAANKKLLHLQPLGGLRTPTGFPDSNARQKRPVLTWNLMQFIHFLFIILFVGFYFHIYLIIQQERICLFMLKFKNPNKHCGSLSGFLINDSIFGIDDSKKQHKLFSKSSQFV